METQVNWRPLHCEVHLPDLDAERRQCDLGRQDHKVARPIRDRRTHRNVSMGMGTDKLGTHKQIGHNLSEKVTNKT